MNRLTSNLKIVEYLEQIVKENPNLRLEQILYILDGDNDYFYEEPEKTLKRWKGSILFNKK